MQPTHSIGELVRVLETAEAHGGKICLPDSGKPKSQAIAEAGLSKSEAYRYQDPGNIVGMRLGKDKFGVSDSRGADLERCRSFTERHQLLGGILRQFGRLFIWLLAIADFSYRGHLGRHIAMLQQRQARNDHGALAGIKMPPVQV
jgi:hypothetical protein